MTSWDDPFKDLKDMQRTLDLATGRTLRKEMDLATGRTQRETSDRLTGAASTARIDQLTGRSASELIDELTVGTLRSQFLSAIQPFPNVSSLRDFQTRQEYLAPARIVDDLGLLNRALEDAEFIGHLSLRPQPTDAQEEEDHGEGTERDEKPQDSGEPEAESREEWLKSVPSEALERLSKVEFLPIRVLDEVLRNPAALRRYSPREFERFIATLIEELGFEQVSLTKQTADGGRDLTAVRLINGIPILFAFECKLYKPENKVGIEILRSLLGTISLSESRANIGVLVTTSSFTRPAHELILTEARIDGKAFDDIVNWVRQARGKLM